MSPDEPAAEALRLAAISPDRARVLATKAEQSARRAGDWAGVSLANRALGVAAFQLRNLDAAAGYLRTSVSTAQRARSPILVAEARMSLAATLVMRGSPGRAINEIDSAIEDLDGLAAARAMVQRATILQAMGRDDEALDAFRHALPRLRRNDDVEWQARALSNRSLLLTARRSFPAAEADLVTAVELCDGHGLDLAGAYAKQNLGCLKATQGEVVAALQLFDDAAAAYQRLGVQVGSLLIDRGELLLSVRLVAEARTNAEAAIRVLQAQHRDMHVPDAQLLLSTVALVQGDPQTALTAAGQAVRSYGRLHRANGVALARYAQLQAMVAADPTAVPPARARRCADDLAAAGWIVPSLEARVLAGRMSLDRGRPADARRDLALAGRARFAGPADRRARAWLAEALLRRSEGKRRSASVALATGLRIVERYQATLGATELRAHVSGHRGALARLGLRMALEDGSARRALAWAERGRATTLLMAPPQPPDDPVLAAELADLRTTMTDIEQQLSRGRGAGELVQRQVRLERSIADRVRRLPARPGAPPTRMPAVRDLGAGLGDAALVEYLELDGVLHAVTVVNGVARLRRLGSAGQLADDLAHLYFALRRLTNSATTRTVGGAGAVLAGIGQRLDELLMAPLRSVLGDRRLVIVPTGVLQSLPWSLLPSCAGRAVTVVPSATLWHHVAQRPAPAGAAVLAVAGPGLPGADAEAAAVAALYAGSRRLIGVAATVSTVSAAMDGAAMVHIAAHGLLRSDNPFFSALLLADGPLTVYDLERLARAPHHVVLAACETARLHVIAGDEVLGFAAALLLQGTNTLIAPVVPVPDAETVSLMNDYHRRLIAGRSPAEALAGAQLQARTRGVIAGAAAAGFLCMGVGLQPVPLTVP